MQKCVHELGFLAGEHQLAAVARVIDAIERGTTGGALMLDDRMPSIRHRRSDHVGAGRKQGVMHGDVDVIAAAGLCASQQRHQHAGKPLQRAEIVGDRNAGNGAAAVVAERQAQRAGQRFQRKIMRRPVVVGAMLTEGRDRAIDDARIARADRIVAEAEACGDTGAKGLNQNIGVIAKTQQRVATCCILQVDHHALLAAVQVAEEGAGPRIHRRDVTSRIALPWRLDLDHLGAVIGERHGEEGSGQEPGQVDDLEAAKLHVDARSRAKISSLSAPIAEQARCSGRTPLIFNGLASTRSSGRIGCAMLRTIPVRRVKGASSACARS
jgi:hypothetical protein